MKHPASGVAGASRPHDGMSFIEFVALIAALMALNALAIDVMLPALPDIGAALDIVNENERQKIVITYLIGFGVAQLFYGPISDRFGRKSVLLGGLGLYTLAGVFSLISDSFDHLLIARFLQGVGCAAPRVVAVSIVRDCYSGRQMGRVMSLAMMVFMAVPILAPSVGQLILFVAPWYWIFATLTGAGVVMVLWSALRLPETLPVEKRSKLDVKTIIHAYAKTLTTRVSFGYMIGTTLIFGALFGFISSAQQIFVGIFNLGVYFPVVFATIALCMSLAAFLNSRLVETVGMRRLSHAALCGFVIVSILHVAIAYAGLESIYIFVAMVAIKMFMFGFVGANFNALAMEPLGDIAGTASSMLGFMSTTGGALLGLVIGQMFDGTIGPITLGYATLGVLSLLTVIWTERGRLFQPIERDEP